MTLSLHAVVADVSARIPQFVDDLRNLVAVDSGSGNREGVNAVASQCEAWLRADGWTIDRLPPDANISRGRTLVARLRGSGHRRVLLVGHLDTVFKDGTAADRPLRVGGELAYGPGVCDMKGGLLLGIWSVRSLLSQGFDDFDQITFVMNPDEEVGSDSSRDQILKEARSHEVAFVLEAARANGAIVSSRKGLTTIHTRITGRAAHAGVEPHKGRSAILAASRIIVALQSLNGGWPDTTINVGTIRGGTHCNVVPEDATMEMEVRAFHRSHLLEAEAEILRVARSFDVDGVSSETVLHHESPPMERTDQTLQLVARAKAIAQELGFQLDDERTGGASDANVIAEAGIPTLDGLGPIGGDDHSDREWIDLSSVGQRAALLAGLVSQASVGADRTP